MTASGEAAGYCEELDVSANLTEMWGFVGLEPSVISKQMLL